MVVLQINYFGALIVKQLNRNQTEEIFKKFTVINSIINQNKSELKIIFTFSNNKKCMVKYSLLDLKKSYFVS